MADLDTTETTETLTSEQDALVIETPKNGATTTEQKPVDNDKADKGKTETLAAEGDKTTKPVEYALKTPEWAKVDEKQLGEFKSLFAEGKVDPAVAQKIADKFFANQQEAAKAALKAQDEAMAKTARDWQAAAKKEFGANYDKTVADARRFLAKYGDAELAKWLKDSGATNLPALIRAFGKAGAAGAEDSIRGTQAAGKGAPKTDADVLREMYPTMQDQIKD